jgi:hypothetical protein
MELALNVSLLVIVTVIVVGVLGYLIDRGAGRLGNDR